MATGKFVLDKGYDVSAAVTKFRCVKYTGVAEQVGPVTGIADDIAGVAQFGVTAAEILKGKGTDVRVLGISEAEVTTAIAIGARCTLEADGRVSVLAAASGKRIVGKCVGHASTAAGDRISMLILQGLGVA